MINMMHKQFDFRAMLMHYLYKNANYCISMCCFLQSHEHLTYFNKNKEQFNCKVTDGRVTGTLTSLEDFTRH